MGYLGAGSMIYLAQRSRASPKIGKGREEKNDNPRARSTKKNIKKKMEQKKILKSSTE